MTVIFRNNRFLPVCVNCVQVLLLQSGAGNVPNEGRVTGCLDRTWADSGDPKSWNSMQGSVIRENR